MSDLPKRQRKKTYLRTYCKKFLTNSRYMIITSGKQKCTCHPCYHFFRSDYLGEYLTDLEKIPKTESKVAFLTRIFLAYSSMSTNF